MVYAYKYFKRLIFINTESKETRTLIFDEEEAKKKDVINMLGPENVTHYWGMSAQIIMCMFYIAAEHQLSYLKN